MRGHVRQLTPGWQVARGGIRRPRTVRRKSVSAVLAVAVSFSALSLTALAPQPVAAAGCYTDVQTGPAKYKIERNFLNIDGTGDAYLKWDGTICWDGTKAYVQSGFVTSWVANRTGIIPTYSRGSFTDSGGTLHVWTDIRFSRSCSGQTFVGWVQLRLWFYKGGGHSAGWYKQSNGQCGTEIHWR